MILSLVLLGLSYLALRKSRDVGLLVYFFYGIVVVREVEVESLISVKGLLVLVLFAISVLVLGRELKLEWVEVGLVSLVFALSLFVQHLTLVVVGVMLLSSPLLLKPVKRRDLGSVKSPDYFIQSKKLKSWTSGK
ncbi:hypothetical protein PFDSM3638_03990 [Pyrococcus furiosus DSM 3638]|uniref:Uncharacterized protein n=3 Tax=Pyrococcus furiosus TaxID=2261 RepID=A0A5C0XQF6_PYRFU|nr:hypothetical protein [Pyrococcus furiosus]AAL80926.1 hypothetical protein PF0802 [Pyrococcus furiosus DSM 3638]AFN03589.1 hypothetical protein PFC_03180 [Pyrococcus furiosus COM1]QEK78478.1 hypothetical protein PFDSM3638_03990 [Pyrococcus furiosus DSM 3638]